MHKAIIRKIFTFINLQLMPPSWGSQQISSAPPQPTWGSNMTLIHIQAGKHHNTLKFLLSIKRE